MLQSSEKRRGVSQGDTRSPQSPRCEYGGEMVCTPSERPFCFLRRRTRDVSPHCERLCQISTRCWTSSENTCRMRLLSGKILHFFPTTISSHIQYSCSNAARH